MHPLTWLIKLHSNFTIVTDFKFAVVPQDLTEKWQQSIAENAWLNRENIQLRNSLQQLNSLVANGTTAAATGGPTPPQGTPNIGTGSRTPHPTPASGMEGLAAAAATVAAAAAGGGGMSGGQMLPHAMPGGGNAHARNGSAGGSSGSPGGGGDGGGHMSGAGEGGAGDGGMDVVGMMGSLGGRMAALHGLSSTQA
jgi:hypothetical protein